MSPSEEGRDALFLHPSARADAATVGAYTCAGHALIRELFWVSILCLRLDC